MSFFESEIVQDELNEINDLQKEVYSGMASFAEFSSEEKEEHISLLYKLLEKQRVIYTRISLSDDPKAVELKQQLQASVQMLGFPPGTDINLLFEGMTETINKLKKQC